jgi:hypothetical protein
MVFSTPMLKSLTDILEIDERDSDKKGITFMYVYDQAVKISSTLVSKFKTFLKKNLFILNAVPFKIEI